jgi:hypothetical protein
MANMRVVNLILRIAEVRTSSSSSSSSNRPLTRPHPFTLHPSHTQLITSIVAFACVATYDWYSSKVQYMLFTVGIDLD